MLTSLQDSLNYQHIYPLLRLIHSNNSNPWFEIKCIKYEIKWRLKIKPKLITQFCFPSKLDLVRTTAKQCKQYKICPQKNMIKFNPTIGQYGRIQSDKISFD